MIDVTIAVANDAALIGIAGGVAALVAVVVAASLTIVLCRRRHRHKRNDAVGVHMAPAPAQQYGVSPLATLPSNDYGIR